MNKQILNELMNQITDKSSDMELLRQALIAEADAVSLYEQLAKKSKTSKVKKVLLDLAQEERVHIGELTMMMNRFSGLQNKADKKALAELGDKNWFQK